MRLIDVILIAIVRRIATSKIKITPDATMERTPDNWKTNRARRRSSSKPSESLYECLANLDLASARTRLSDRMHTLETAMEVDGSHSSNSKNHNYRRKLDY